MKKLFKFLPMVAALLAGAALVAHAATPSYKTKTASGTTTCQVIYPAEAGNQIRIVSANITGDHAATAVAYATATTAYKVTAANASSSGVTQAINRTFGMPANAALILQKIDGTCYSGTLSSTNSGTNAVLTSGGFGAATVAGDQIFVLSTATTITVGNATSVQNGEALFVGNSGRPVRLLVTGSTSACAINSSVARYE